MISFVRTAAVISALVLAVAGCGGGSDSDSDDPSKGTETSTASAAGGTEIEGEGYTFSAPEGWETPEEAIPGTEAADTFAADLGDDDGFADNVNVLRQDPTPGELTDDIEEDLAGQLEAAGAKNVVAHDRKTVDGDEAVHISSTQANAAENLTEQYYVVHDDVLYVITTSFSKDVSQDDRDEIGDSILASWKWAA